MKKLGICVLASLLFFACQPGQDPTQVKMRSEIKMLESQLMKVKDVTKDKATAQQLIEKTTEYAKQYPQDTLTPTLLFQAGDVAKEVKNYSKAMELWEQVWRGYKTHRSASMALFLQGFTFDSELHDPTMATKYYKKFLTTFPHDSVLVPQVKQLLSVINVKPEELIKKYETE
ncbi:MAG: hypothetical protein GC192_13710 [Bacteroidetes bacterium]|nr:hypothetical protein [Bacteroidota bacterium]